MAGALDCRGDDAFAMLRRHRATFRDLNGQQEQLIVLPELPV